MSDLLKTITLDGTSKKVIEYSAGSGITFTPNASDATKVTISADTVDPSDYYTKTQTDTLLNNKVDKVTGKGLSTNDYTTAEKTKLAGITWTKAGILTALGYKETAFSITDTDGTVKTVNILIKE